MAGTSLDYLQTLILVQLNFGGDEENFGKEVLFLKDLVIVWLLERLEFLSIDHFLLPLLNDSLNLINELSDYTKDCLTKAKRYKNKINYEFY